jgi:hypothetical protein
MCAMRHAVKIGASSDASARSGCDQQQLRARRLAAGPANDGKEHGPQRVQQPRALHHGQCPGFGHQPALLLIEAEAVAPDHQRAEDQLVVQQDDDEHGRDRPADRAQ